MRMFCLAFLAVLLTAAAARGEETPAPAPSPPPAPPAVGAVVFEADFEAADALAAWPGRTGKVQLDAGPEGGRAVCIESTDAAGGAHVAIPLAVEPVRGCRLLVAAMVRAENVSAKPQDWNGIKFMMPLVAGAAKTWPQADIGVGTFGWRRVVWQAIVPAGATEASLVLGLERVTGKVWFDDVRITVRRPPIVAKPRPAAGPVYRGHDLARLRGAMVSPSATADDLRTLGRVWKANLIRWQLTGFKPGIDTGDPAVYDAFLEGELKKLDAALPVCEEVGLMVVVDLHTGPGHWAEGEKNLFASAACQKRFVEIWEGIARRYKDAKAVWGYDLLNEPLENAAAEDTLDWQGLAEKAARAVRAIDPHRAIIVEPAPWGGPDAIRNLQPIDVPGVVYSVHMYAPFAFTHQGVFGDPPKPIAYPGEIEGKRWDKAALEAALAPVIEFQKTYGVHIFLGEFSAIRWAPDSSAQRYLSDCIDIFESHGWDWTYHAFREWSGWSAEHGSDRADAEPAKEPTDRQRLLMGWFAKNARPAWAKP